MNEESESPPSRIPEQPKTVPLPMARAYLVCVFCRNPLIELHVATAPGVQVTACKEHGPIANMLANEVSKHGDDMMRKFQKAQAKAAKRNGASG